MKISDLKDNEIIVGLRVQGKITGRFGRITEIRYPPAERYRLALITWDGDTEAYSGFYENQSDLEVIFEKNGRCFK
jgi:hypothetical protein